MVVALTASALALGTSTSTGAFKRSASGDGVEALFLSCTARSALSDLASVNSRFSLYSRRLASVSDQDQDLPCGP